MSLCEAVADGEVERVRALLARGEDPNKKEEGHPYSSKPVLLFRIIGSECGIDTRS